MKDLQQHSQTALNKFYRSNLSKRSANKISTTSITHSRSTFHLYDTSYRRRAEEDKDVPKITKYLTTVISGEELNDFEQSLDQIHINAFRVLSDIITEYRVLNTASPPMR